MRALFLALALVGCKGTAKGTETGNPNMEVAARVTSTAWTARPSEVSIGPGGATVVDGAWVWLERVRFVEDCSSEDGDGPDDSEDDLAAVLELTGGTEVELKTPVSDYCRAEVELDAPNDSPPTAPPGMEGATLIVEGVLPDQSAFRIVSTEALKIRMEGAFAVTRTDRSLALGFEVSGWFTGLDLEGLALDGGVRRLDEETDPGQLEDFEQNLADALGLYVDADDDGVLDPEEIDEPVALPSD